MSSAPDFDAMYRADPDPWNVEDSWYERRKLAVVLASLPDERYATAWEPGCGPGIVSRALAGRVDDLVASDGSEQAVRMATRRCRDLRQVRVVHSELPEVPLRAPVDLVLVAEFLYYVADLDGALDAVWSAGRPGAHLAFVHWAHRPHDAFRSGPEMHAQIEMQAISRHSTRVVSHVEREFLLDIYRTAP